jgi:hypothetical protein
MRDNKSSRLMRQPHMMKVPQGVQFQTYESLNIAVHFLPGNKL